MIGYHVVALAFAMLFIFAVYGILTEKETDL